MKKIFTIIAIVMAAALINSCGTASKFSNDPYVAEGTGIAMKKDAAYNIAFMEACAKLAQKYNFVVDYSVRQNYESDNIAKGKNSEHLYNAQKTTGKAHIEASDIVVTKYRYRKVKDNKVECEMVVKVSPDNLR